VWALLGPGLSDPGHIEIHSRTVYLDSDSLLGPREAIAAGALEQRAILRTFGVALHETLHAKHTKRWAIEHDIALSASQDPGDRQLAEDRRLLEEPRMEAHGVRDFPPDSLRGRFIRRALQAAVVDVILPAFAEQMIANLAAGVAPSRDLAARSTVYLQARTHYGVLDPAVLKPMHAVWDRVLGAEDLSALDDLYASVIWSPDGDLHRLDAAARTYRGIVGEPEQAPSTAGRSGDPTGAPMTRVVLAGPTWPTEASEPVAARRARSPTRSSRRSPPRATDNSSSSTSISGECCETRPLEARAGRSSGGATVRGSRPGGCPTAASTARRTPTRCGTPAATPTGCAGR